MDRPGDALDLLDVLEGLSAWSHEHQEAILRWPWKLFCVKWTRMLRYADRERRQEAERKREAEFRRLRSAHRGL